jgi:hypothetical protein
MVSDDKPLPSVEIEFSPINPRAHRIPGGIWNEDELPVLPWEAAEHRKVLPPSIQRWIGADVPVVRVSLDVVRKQYEKHSDVRAWFDGFEIDAWAYARPVADKRNKKWEFVQLIYDDSGAPWPPMTVVGVDSSGRYNVISMHRKNRRWMRKLVMGHLGFMQRER